jgi:hypothetical protein
MSYKEPHDGTVHIEKKEARQARRGLPVLVVLIASVSILVVAYMLIYAL